MSRSWDLEIIGRKKLDYILTYTLLPALKDKVSSCYLAATVDDIQVYKAIVDQP